MQLTSYQEAILGAVRGRIQTKDDKPGLIVEALAGTGKSTILAEIAGLLNSLGIAPNACRFVVFGKKNQLDLAAKIGKIGNGWGKSVQTLNSLGYSILRDAMGKSHRFYNLKSTKYLQIARDLGYLDKRDRDGNHNPGRLSYSENSPIRSDKHFTELLEKLRLHCYGPDDVDVDAVAKMDKRYRWEFKSRHLEEIANAARHCLSEGMAAADNGRIDFLDQIYYPTLYASDFAATFDLWASRLKFIAIDEAQDTDLLQINFLKLLHRPTQNFICAVGDRNQAVYYFRGCLSNGLNYLAHNFNCESLSLPINYRCGIRHLELVREIFPNIEIQPHDGAPPGEIRCIRDVRLVDIVSDRSLSYFGVSRKNAPLLSTAIKFLTSGIPAKIKDRNLGDSILKTLEKISGKGGKKYDLQTFLMDLDDWQNKELGRYSSEQKHQEINDLAACFRALFDSFNLETFADWKNKIDEIFDESKTDEKPIDLYTIHSGKGGEGEVSFIVNPDDMPITYKSQTEEERAQEDNMIYVALTRCLANSKQGCGIFYLIIKTDEDLDPIWPKWLPKKYRKFWGVEDEKPEDIVNAAAEESSHFSGEASFDGSDEIWSCPICDADNFETATCFNCGYQLPEVEGLESEEISQNIEPIEVVAESLESEPEPETSPAPVSFEAHKSKSERVKEILLSGSDISGEQIATQAGCSAMLVSKVRKKLVTEGLLEPVAIVKTADGRVMNVSGIGTVAHQPRQNKLDKARELLEDLTGDELCLLFQEFLGPLPSNNNDDEDDDIPF